MLGRYGLVSLVVVMTWVAVGVAAGSGPPVGGAASASVPVSRPLVVQDGVGVAQQRGDGPPLPSHIKRQGQVLFETDTFLPRPAPEAARRATADSFRQRVLVLGLFPDQTYYILVDSEDRPGVDQYRLIGRIEGEALATVSLVVTPQSYLLTIEDLADGLTYRVVGDSESGIGRVTEIDPAQLPPRLYSPPLIPPDN